MVYSESGATDELYQVISKKYSHSDIRIIHRIIADLIKSLTGDGKYAYHYNKYTIIINCLHRFYKDYPHGNEIVHSYSSFISEQLQIIRSEEYDTKKQRSSFCSYCIIS